jgi:hypothetical protein
MKTREKTMEEKLVGIFSKVIRGVIYKVIPYDEGGKRINEVSYEINWPKFISWAETTRPKFLQNQMGISLDDIKNMKTVEYERILRKCHKLYNPIGQDAVLKAHRTHRAMADYIKRYGQQLAHNAFPE